MIVADGLSEYEELAMESDGICNRFHSCRVGIRFMMHSYLASKLPPAENYVGLICPQTLPKEIAKRAIDDAAFLCTRRYGDSPKVILKGQLDLAFSYIPVHLRMLRHSTCCLRCVDMTY